MSATILLLEDDEVLQDLLREVLQDEGYTIVAAKSLDELLHVTPQHVDLLITDLLVDFQTVGLNAIEQVRQVTRPELPALICTAAQKQIASLQPEIERLHARILEKPFTIDDLVSSVNHMLVAHEARPAAVPALCTETTEISQSLSLLQASFA
jgi:DNA-binding NtrC family response regulator